MHIYLIRHGETDWNTKFLFQGQSDIELNENGIMQAKSIAKEFKGRKISGIISSDLKRAYKTAEIIASACECKTRVRKDKCLRERDYGNFEGKHYDLYHNNRKDFKGEKDSRFIPRVNAVFKAIVKKYKGKDIIIVSHGGVVRQIIAFILGLKEYRKLRIYNASVSELFYNEKKKAFFVLLVNSVAHLPRKERNKIEYHIKGV
jgi:broad specificity phosphatase PhoE